MGMKSCLICCYSFTPPSGSTMPHFRDFRNRRLLKFCKGFLPNFKSSLVLDELDCLKLDKFGKLGDRAHTFARLSLCNDCLSIILSITERKSRVDQLEEQLRVLQQQGLREMEGVCKEMKRLEELMEAGDVDVACVDDELPSSLSWSNEVVALRDTILKAATDLRIYGSNLSSGLSSHHALCHCGANINISTSPPPPMSASNTVCTDFDFTMTENEDIDLDVKLFDHERLECPSAAQANTSHSPSPPRVSTTRSAIDERSSSLGQADDKNKSRDKSVLVLKILKNARHRRRQHAISHGGGVGRPRDPIREEFDLERDTGKAKCRMCSRLISFRVDVMKSHKLCCAARRQPNDHGDDQHDLPKESLLSGVQGKLQEENELTEEMRLPGVKTEEKPKLQWKATGNRMPGSRVQGRPRDSIWNEFDLTNTGKAKCRNCNRAISYRVDVMKNHKMRCLTNSTYPSGHADVELDEETGELRIAGSKWSRQRRRISRTIASTPGRPKDSIRDEFDLTDTGKARCKKCYISISYRVDVMKNHRMRCRIKSAQLN